MSGRHRIDDSVYAATEEIALPVLHPTPPPGRDPQAAPAPAALLREITDDLAALNRKVAAVLGGRS